MQARQLLIALLFIATCLKVGAVDTDRDGLSDSFEDFISFDKNDENDVLGDPNQNGFSAWVEYLHAENNGTGSPIAGTPSWSHEALDDVTANPVLGEDGILYVISRDKKLYALNPDGSEAWSYDFGASTRFAPAVAVDGTIYILTGINPDPQSNNRAELIALDASGVYQWAYELSDLAVAPPVAADNGNVYVVSRDRRLTAIASDGTEAWVFDADTNITHAPAVDADGSILLVSKHRLWRITVTGASVWQYEFDGEIAGTPSVNGLGTAYVPIKERQVVAVDSFKNVEWTYDADGYLTGSPAVSSDSEIYFADIEGTLYKLDSNGAEQWKFEANDQISTSPVVGHNGNIYFGVRSRTIYSLDSNKLVRWTFETDGFVDATPTLTKNGIVYTVDVEGKLYALLDNTIGEAAWAMERKNLRGNSHQCWSPWGYIYYTIDSDEDGKNDCEEFQAGTLELPQPPTGPASGTITADPARCYITTGNSSCSVDLNWSTSQVVFGKLWRNNGGTWGYIDDGTEGSIGQSGVTPAGVQFELHEGTDRTALLTSLTVKAGSGAITGDTTCEIEPGVSTCQVSFDWSTVEVDEATLWRQESDGSWTDVASGTGGTSSHNVDVAGTRFELHVGTTRGIELASHYTYGLLSTGVLTINPNTCDIPSGETDCSVYATWSTTNSSTASVWRSDGGGNWTLVSNSTRKINKTISGVTTAGTDLELHWGPYRLGQPLASVSVSAVYALDDDDNDGYDNESDNCPLTSNSSQADYDSDGYGDACDEDKDGDSYENSFENYCGSDPLDSSDIPSQACRDQDQDGDSISDGRDSHQTSAKEHTNSDTDSYGNNADLDDDDDGVPDEADFYPEDDTRFEDEGAGVFASSLYLGTDETETNGLTALETVVEAGPTAYSTFVDGDGRAMISIPIPLIPGVNGLAPELSLNYDSGRWGDQVDNNLSHGVLGYGWTLEGLSRIHRCEQRVENAPDVQFDDTDELCLDGELLVPIGAEDTFHSNAEYRTERDAFARITPSGSGFQVETYDGRMLLFGTTTDSRIEAGGTDVDYVWALHEEKDRFGNIITYSYHSDQDTGEIYPHTIAYEGVKITFEYAKREREATPRVAIGSGYTQSSVYLHKLTVASESGAKPVREFVLGNDLIGKRRLLTWVQHCGYDEDGVNRKCLKELRFNWKETISRVAVEEIHDSLGAETEYEYEDYLAVEDVQSLYANQFQVDPTLGCGASELLEDLDGNTFHYSRRAYAKSMTVLDSAENQLNKWEYSVSATPKFLKGNRGYAGHELLIERDVSDISNKVTTYMRRELCFPFTGRVVSGATYAGEDFNGQKLSKAENSWSDAPMHGGKSRFVYPAGSIAINYEWNGSDHVQFGVRETSTTYQYSNDLPAQRSVVEETSASATEIANWYSLDNVERTTTTVTAYEILNISEWLNGFVTSVQTTHEADGDSKSQTITFEQYTTSGNDKTMAVEEVEEPRGDAGTLTTTFAYDDLTGNLEKISQEVGANTLETEILSYEESRYPASVDNPANETTTQTYDKRFGTPRVLTAPDGRQTTVTRDPFGRVTRVEETTESNKNQSVSMLFKPAAYAVAGQQKSYFIEIIDTAAPDRRIYFDRLGRQVSHAKQAFESEQWIFEDAQYDPRGRVVVRTVPYSTNLPTGDNTLGAHTSFQFDNKDRVTQRNNPDGGEYTYSYVESGNKLEIKRTERVEFDGQLIGQGLLDTYQRLNALGQVVEAEDADGLQTTFSYDALGNLDSSQVGSTPATTIEYDAIGQRKYIDEPHTGVTAFMYTQLGQLERQCRLTAVGNCDNPLADRIVRYEYDLAGRIANRYDDDQNATPTVNTWQYGTTGKETGKLVSETQDLPGGSGIEFTRTYTYNDNSKRLENITTTVDNSYVTNQQIEVGYTYDEEGRIETIDYDGIVVENDYNGQGYHESISREGRELEKIEAMSNFGQATRTKFGNGILTERMFNDVSGRLENITSDEGVIQKLTYEWRTDGTLHSRQEGTNREEFEYDTLKRLKSATVNGFGRKLMYLYDPLGNLTSKTSSVATDGGVTGYTYNSAKPNAVTNATVGSHNMELDYDDVGNVTSISSSTTDSRTFTYDAHNLVTSIQVDDTSSQIVASEEFAYGPDNQRYFRRSMWDDDGTMMTTSTIYALGGKVEKVIIIGAPNVTKIRITDTVLYQKERAQYLYMHRDHLGSIHKITSDLGEVESSYSFDPFGSRRNADWDSSLTTEEVIILLNSIANQTWAGFTGHEPLDRTGVIHMNGRIYDPVLGRFLNADPIVQNPTMSQNHNRYSYVLNNPLSAFDPTGFRAECRSDNCPVTVPTSSPWSPFGPWSPLGPLSPFHLFPFNDTTSEKDATAEVNAQENHKLQRTLGILLAGLEEGFGGHSLAGQTSRFAMGVDAGVDVQQGGFDHLTYLPVFDQTTVDLVVGVGDGILLGQGGLLRDIVSVDGGVDPTSDEYGIGYGIGVATTTALITRGASRGYRTGAEFKVGKNFRVAPFGNRTNHPIGRYPHYHRRGVDPATGLTKPGQGIGRHRPFEKKSTDKKWWERF